MELYGVTRDSVVMHCYGVHEYPTMHAHSEFH